MAKRDQNAARGGIKSRSVYTGDIIGSRMQIESDCRINYPYADVRMFIEQLRAAGELQEINAPIGIDGEYAALTSRFRASQCTSSSARPTSRSTTR